jgi:hypothetical protein
MQVRHASNQPSSWQSWQVPSVLPMAMDGNVDDLPNVSSAIERCLFSFLRSFIVRHTSLIFIVEVAVTGRDAG